LCHKEKIKTACQGFALTSCLINVNVFLFLLEKIKLPLMILAHRPKFWQKRQKRKKLLSRNYSGGTGENEKIKAKPSEFIWPFLISLLLFEPGNERCGQINTT